MPIIKSAVKRMHQAAKARVRNAATKRSLKTSVKAFHGKMSAETLKKAYSELDKAVKKNLLEKNTAARRKANLAKLAKQAGVTFGATKAKKTEAKPAIEKTTKKVAEKPTAKPAAKKAAPAKKPATKKPAAKKSAK